MHTCAHLHNNALATAHLKQIHQISKVQIHISISSIDQCLMTLSPGLISQWESSLRWRGLDTSSESLDPSTPPPSAAWWRKWPKTWWGPAPLLGVEWSHLAVYESISLNWKEWKIFWTCSLVSENRTYRPPLFTILTQGRTLFSLLEIQWWLCLQQLEHISKPVRDHFQSWPVQILLIQDEH